MGSSSSRADKGSKALINSKLDAAANSGILDLSNQDLKASSLVWDRIQTQGLAVKLHKMDISGNTLKYLPWEILNMTQLEVLHASRCNIQRGYDMSALPRLMVLHVNDNDLEAETLAPLPPSLTHLNISNNHFVTIPSRAFADLAVLSELDLSGNRLKTIDGLGTLVSLRILKLDGNRLVDVSADLCSCVQLVSISLRNNELANTTADELQSIPAGLFYYTQLVELILSGNKQLKLQTVLAFDGVGAFRERRSSQKVKNRKSDSNTSSNLFYID